VPNPTDKILTPPSNLFGHDGTMLINMKLFAAAKIFSMQLFGTKFVADGAILGVINACMELLAATTTKTHLYFFSDFEVVRSAETFSTCYNQQSTEWSVDFLRRGAQNMASGSRN
jgi:hypothetical protein